MPDLTPQQRLELRAKAHHLHPVVSIGQHGLTPTVLHEIDVALSAHGLVKVRVFSDDRPTRDAMLVQIAGELDAAPVQHLGKLLIVYRPLPQVPKKKAPAKKKHPKRKPAAPGTKQAPGKKKSGAAKSIRRPRSNAEREHAPIAGRERAGGTAASVKPFGRDDAPKGRRQRGDGRDTGAAPAPRTASAARKRMLPGTDAKPASATSRRLQQPEATARPGSPQGRARKSPDATVTPAAGARRRREPGESVARGAKSGSPPDSRRRRRAT